ncbi:MAG: aldo/keto reductase [Sumerlaeia bacterium]
MTISRRRFLSTLGCLLVGGTALRTADAQAPDLDSYRLPERTLGATGLRCSLLGIGTGTNGWGGRSAQTELGRRELVSLLEYAHDRGVTFFDLADQYGSHGHMRAALTSGGGTIPREKVFILTKTHARTAAEMRADLDRFRKEIGTDRLDVVLLHCEVSADWNVSHRGAMDVLSEAKANGIVGAHGVSCHSLGALRTAAREPWVEVDLARLNPWERQMDGDLETVKSVLGEFRERGAGVIGMKILAAGAIRGAADVEEGIRHAIECGLLDCLTVGMRSRAELDQLLRVVASVQET